MQLLEYNPDDYVAWHKRLWAAVLRRAILDYGLYRDHQDPAKRAVGMEAGEWLFQDTPDMDQEFASFTSVCRYVGVCPLQIRALLRKNVIPLDVGAYAHEIHK